MSNPSTSGLPPVMTAEEFFTFLRVGHTVGYDSLRRGTFPFAVRVGRQWRIPRDAMLQWLAQEKAASAGRNMQAADRSE